MINLSKLNGKPFVLNADLIHSVEQNPDTTIKLTTGERIVVRESMQDVIARAVEYHRYLRALRPPA